MKKGFTLIELMIVIAIIALLFSLMIPGIKNMPGKTNEYIIETNKVSNLKEMIVPFSDLNEDGKIVQEEIDEFYYEILRTNNIKAYDNVFYQYGEKIPYEKVFGYFESEKNNMRY